MTDKIDLIATKAMTYNTRRLIADDVFQARPRDARLLVAIGKARIVNAVEAVSERVVPAQASMPPKTVRTRRAKTPKA